jgi:hypothetical protein
LGNFRLQAVKSAILKPEHKAVPESARRHRGHGVSIIATPCFDGINHFTTRYIGLSFYQNSEIP